MGKCRRLVAHRLMQALAIASLLVATWLTSASQVAAAKSVKLAVFNFELNDTSLSGAQLGVNSKEQQRLIKISDLLRAQLAKSGDYVVADLAPAQAEIEDAGFISSCNGCDADIAKKLGAQLAITGVVNKVSNLILSINLNVRGADTGELLGVWTADIRGNTDESWSHGVKWLVRNRMLKALATYE